MKIDSIEIQSYRTSFIQPFITSNQKYNYRSGWYLKISSEGYQGIGEIAPLENFSPDYNYLIEKKITKIIQLSSDFSLDEMCKYISDELISFPSIQFGFETAIYDILSKVKNLSLSRFWNRDSLDKVFCNSIANINQSIANINNVVKIKISSLSIEQYKFFFDKILNLNPSIKFRLDFNGSLNLKNAKKWIQELTNYNIDYIEQPLPKEQMVELADLCNFSNIPIAVDESITDLASAYKIIENNAADIFIIKPMISGGYFNSKKIIELGNDNNIRSIITTSLETEIGFLANLHIASALNITEYCGFSTWNLFIENPPKYVYDNYVILPKKPGLGN